MVLTKVKTFTECEIGHVEHLNIDNERTHGNLQAMRLHHVNQPTGTYAMPGNVNMSTVNPMHV